MVFERFYPSRFKIPSFMVTLGIGYITTGLGVLITRGNPVVITDWSFRLLSLGKIGFLPFPFILALGLFLVTWFISEKTAFGRYVLALGGDETIVQDLGYLLLKLKAKLFNWRNSLWDSRGFAYSALGFRRYHCSFGFYF